MPSFEVYVGPFLKCTRHFPEDEIDVAAITGGVLCDMTGGFRSGEADYIGPATGCLPVSRRLAVWDKNRGTVVDQLDPAAEIVAFNYGFAHEIELLRYQYLTVSPEWGVVPCCRDIRSAIAEFFAIPPAV